MVKLMENVHMALMRVRRMAQLTLPAEIRRALNVQEGDYLEGKRLAKAADFSLNLNAGYQAAARAGEPVATFQGRSSAMRLIGWPAMRPSTSRR
jgi:hypothetical protein